MLNRPRVIPVLTIMESDLVKTTQFKNPRYLGDPINAVKIFNEKKVDELCILDIGATKKESPINFKLLESIASQAFMPLSYGGGINNIHDIKRLFKLGFEKVILNSAVPTNSSLIIEASKLAGSQSIVLSIDIKKSLMGGYSIVTHSGQNKIETSIEEYLRAQVAHGFGEILVNSVDNDGMMSGYDLKIMNMISEIVEIPIIACGGAGNILHIKEAINEGKANAAAAGSMFVYFGKHKAVLINFPTEDDFHENGIFS